MHTHFSPAVAPLWKTCPVTHALAKGWAADLEARVLLKAFLSAVRVTEWWPSSQLSARSAAAAHGPAPLESKWCSAALIQLHPLLSTLVSLAQHHTLLCRHSPSLLIHMDVSKMHRRITMLDTFFLWKLQRKWNCSYWRWDTISYFTAISNTIIFSLLYWSLIATGTAASARVSESLCIYLTRERTLEMYM